ncbi:MAG TPA: bifunctional glutamate N-acetyltransferase/amino-acid acetyltransferase ArgJ [Dissulfurispiraceae bacterium]|nr:bifunctional glutamate N-acetyltransferase/amino-acid acetyltransferase ArgJ [Dissulfurispiraceae bacterium]
MDKSGEIKIPKGFLFATAEAAIKKPGRRDMALIVSEKEAAVAGVFTTNRVKAAPVRMDMRQIRKGKGQAIVMNSGNANACTGAQGMEDAVEMGDLTASLLGISPRSVYVCSTGVIGTPLPMQRIRSAMPGLCASLGKWTIADVAAAIMTTDTFPKMAARTVRIGGKTCIISGVCKGAGMIAPRMATMLCSIITDVFIGSSSLRVALREAVGRTFNRITVDGDMSTNDTVLIMANGMAGNREIVAGTPEHRVFATALTGVAGDLSRLVVRDGEGATKVVEVIVRRAKSDREARRAARAVADSLLVKTAMYGNDANWGRIMAALGYSGIALDEPKVDIYLNGLAVVKGGLGKGNDKAANERLRAREVSIEIDLGIGTGSDAVMTCDLTEEYVKINAEYRT